MYIRAKTLKNFINPNGGKEKSNIGAFMTSFKRYVCAAIAN